jgi:hypothetical protein
MEKTEERAQGHREGLGGQGERQGTVKRHWDGRTGRLSGTLTECGNPSGRATRVGPLSRTALEVGEWALPRGAALARSDRAPSPEHITGRVKRPRTTGVGPGSQPLSVEVRHAGQRGTANRAQRARAVDSHTRRKDSPPGPRGSGRSGWPQRTLCAARRVRWREGGEAADSSRGL